MQDLPRQPSTASANPWGRQAAIEAASAAFSVRACDEEAKHLADTVLGNLQQPSQLSTEPAQDACSSAEGGAQAALSADRAPECITPEAAEQGLLMRSAPLSPLQLQEPAQEAPAATLGMQDMLDLLLPPVLHTNGHNVPPQKLSRPRKASRAALSSAPAAAGAEQCGAEQQQGELPTSSQQPDVQKPRPKLRARRAEACTGLGPSSSCMPAAAPGDEFSPEHECVICLDDRRCVMVAPCGHVPYCFECAEQLCGPGGIHAFTRGQVCPLCQAKVYATVSKTFY